jgi:hypothetical protein
MGIQSVSGTDLYYKVGSTINLICVLNENSKHIHWTLNENQIEENDRTTIQTSSTASNLKVEMAQESDSGSYTCSASTVDRASIKVHVISGYP